MIIPLISNFYGIMIYMYYEDHNPPHFHARYEDDEALIDIQNGCVYKGKLPTKQVKLVLAWCEIHRDELIDNWNRSKGDNTLITIAPLK